MTFSRNRARIAGLALCGLLLSGCGIGGDSWANGTDQGQNTSNSSQETQDNNSQACKEALGLDNLKPSTNLADLPGIAKRRAAQYVELRERVRDGEIRGVLSDLADSYLELQRRKIDRMSDFFDWLRRTTGNMQRLKEACK